MDDKLTELVERLNKAHQDRLVSVVLYGSAAAGDHHENFSDLNVLCVLTAVTVKELAEFEPVLKWWRAQGNPSPLLMSEHEVQTSTDCFPIEFHDMQEQRRVLFGKDVIADLVIDRSFYRAQVEHELRAKLLRLRQKCAGLLSDEKALLRLMLDSVSTFLVLARHALLLSGISADWKKRGVLSRLPEIGVDASPFERLLDVREQKRKASELEPGPLLEPYLREIEALVSHVDRLEK
ncbi:MAG: nucleotidyltransferase domain-containing protein [Bryobacteraceae bacterium]